MNAADMLLAVQALRLLTDAVARFRATGQMDAEQLAAAWETVSARSRQVAAELDAALDAAEATPKADPAG